MPEPTADEIKAAFPEVEPDDADVIEPTNPDAVTELVTEWEPTTDDELGEDA